MEISIFSYLGERNSCWGGVGTKNDILGGFWESFRDRRRLTMGEGWVLVLCRSHSPTIHDFPFFLSSAGLYTQNSMGVLCGGKENHNMLYSDSHLLCPGAVDGGLLYTGNRFYGQYMKISGDLLANWVGDEQSRDGGWPGSIFHGRRSFESTSCIFYRTSMASISPRLRFSCRLCVPVTLTIQFQGCWDLDWMLCPDWWCVFYVKRGRAKGYSPEPLHVGESDILSRVGLPWKRAENCREMHAGLGYIAEMRPIR